MRRLFLLLKLALTVCCLVGEATNIAALGNQAAYQKLCAIIALLDSSPKLPNLQGADEQLWDGLLKLNMSLSPLSWREIFKKPGKEDEWEATKPERFAGIKDWDTKWAKWSTIAQAVAKATTETEALKAYGADNLNPNQKAAALAALQPVLERIVNLRSHYPAQPRPEEVLTEDKFKKAIAQAVFGSDTIPGDHTPIAAQMYTNGGTTGHANNCISDGETGQTKTIAATVTCLCANAAANGVTDACSRLQNNGASNWNGNAADAPAQAKTLIELCPRIPSLDLTAAALGQQVRSVEELISIKSSNGYLGEFKATSCDGANSKGLCVQYTGYTVANRKPFTETHWVKQLTELTLKLKTLEDAARRAEQLTQIIEAEKEAAKAVISAAHRAELAATDSQESTKQQDPKAKKDTAAKDCNAAGDDQKACEKLKEQGCVYDPKGDEGKKCKLSEEAKQKAAEKATATGDAGPAATSGCTAHKDKNACDADKTGDKQNCAWRKGKDGETDEPEKEKCRNGSFLLNKQLALSMVSAAFVALLF